MVYLGKDTMTGLPIACKLMGKLKKHKLKFLREVTILRDAAKEGKGSIGFPVLHHYDAKGDVYAVVMERLGPSLKHLRDTYGKQMSLKHIIQIGL